MRICLVLEGCYPYVHGGVSTWMHGYIQAMPEHEFVLWVIGAHAADRGKFVYELPKNVVEVHEVFLDDALRLSGEQEEADFNDRERDALRRLVSLSNPDWDVLFDIFQRRRVHPLSFLQSRTFMDIFRDVCLAEYPYTPFADAFHTMRSMLLPVLYLLGSEVPVADVYHAISTGYGGLLAWALFSWLFRTGSAYFYAALPVRRRTLFLTNYLTGLLLCAAPALVSSLLLWAVGAGFGVSAFLPAMQVFAATAMGFLLFFSFASLVCMVVGQMAAAPLVYGMLNFAAYVLESIVQHLMQTFVYGMPAGQTTAAERAAAYASPVFGLLRGGFRVATEWVDAGAVGYETDPHLVGWGYLGILAGVGVIFAVCAYLLLQHREMERSGDVIAVRQLRPAALYGFTIGCALVIGVLLVELLSGNAADNFWYVLLFLTIGAFVGYFTGKMLLQKTVFVFRSGWGGFAACCLVLAVVFGAAKFDLFGYSRYLPQRSRIAAAGLTRNEYQGLYTSQDPAFIDRVLALHTAAVEEKPQQEQRKTDYQRGTDQTQGFYISYRLTDGRLLQRYYSVVYNEADALASGSLISQFSSVYNSPDCVRIRTGFDTPRTEANVLSCYVYSNASDADLELTGAHAWELYAACLADINAGRLGAEDVSGVGTKDDADYTPLYLMFIVTTNTPGETVNLYVDSIPLGADETVRVLEQAGAEIYWKTS